MDKINVGQQRAISHKDGPMLLLAGPGSGKTFVITHRIQRLIESGISPGSILVITFTRAAATQMQERFLTLNKKPYSDVVFGTFHSIFFNILKNHKSYLHFSPISEKEKIAFINRAIEITELTAYIRGYDDVYSCLSLISACKNNGNIPEVYAQNMFESDDFTRLFNCYNSLLSDFEKIDFDDMVNDCLDLLKEDEQELTKWQTRFKYILIDEFQDISKNQFDLVKLLAAPDMNVFAVGDDDQSIYQFRGADVGLMKRFLDEFPGTKEEYLSINYRSTGNIVEAARLIIEENSNRFTKEIKASKDHGDCVEIIHVPGGVKEKEKILELISCPSTNNLNDVALLTRTNRQASEYASFLQINNIPVNYRDKKKPFSDECICDLLTYLRMSQGSDLREDFLRIMNKPIRYIKRSALRDNHITKQDILMAYSSDLRMQATVLQLYDHLQRIKNMRPFLAIKYIRNTIQYENYLKEKYDSEKYNEIKEILDEFEIIAKGFPSVYELENYIKQVQELSEIKTSDDIQEGVTIMTYHASKGLEFETVILPGLNEGIVPPRNANGAFAIEEERRMLYVAMTRAKDKLFLIYRDENGKKVSRFLMPLLK